MSFEWHIFHLGPVEPELIMWQTIVPTVYIIFGFIGICGNSLIITFLSKFSQTSTFILMKNIAISDTVMCMVVGCYVGLSLLHEEFEKLETVICFLDVCCWFVGIQTYAALGLNRYFGVCANNSAKFNLPKVAVAISVFTWITGSLIGLASVVPTITLGMASDLMTMSYYGNMTRAQVIMWTNVATNALSITIQWICSTAVLVEIWKTKTSHRQRPTAAKQKYKHQVRLFLQFFYPSVICTLSSLMFFLLPFYADQMAPWSFVVSHSFWLTNHMCNPFIYFYFNKKLRTHFKTLLAWPIDGERWQDTTTYASPMGERERAQSAPESNEKKRQKPNREQEIFVEMIQLHCQKRLGDHVLQTNV